MSNAGQPPDGSMSSAGSRQTHLVVGVKEVLPGGR
jgi:hypothetical protein